MFILNITVSGGGLGSNNLRSNGTSGANGGSGASGCVIISYLLC